MYTLLIGAIFIGLSLGVMGSGGAILTIPVLMYGFEQPEKLAILNSLAIVAIIALASTARNMSNDTIRWNLVGQFGSAGLIGTYFGVMLGNSISGQAQLAIFTVTLMLSAIKMYRTATVDQPANCEMNTSPWLIPVAGLGVGLLTGIIGVGGGFLIVPALILLTKVSLQQAVATSLVIICFNSVLGFTKYFYTGNYAIHSFDWWPIFIISSIGIVASLFGQQCAKRLPQRALKKGFSLMLVAVAVYISSQLISVLG